MNLDDGSMEANYSLMSSLIAKLDFLDKFLEELRKKMEETKDKTDKVALANKEMDQWLSASISRIYSDVTSKLVQVQEKLKSHQMDKRAEGIKLQQDISMLKKEKLQLYQQISDITKRLEDVETIIGYDVKIK